MSTFCSKAACGTGACGCPTPCRATTPTIAVSVSFHSKTARITTLRKGISKGKNSLENFSALEAAKNQQTPHHFNEAAAFEREVAAMRRDAEALEAKRREQYEYDLRTPLPRQSTGAPLREQYVPGVHET